MIPPLRPKYGITLSPSTEETATTSDTNAETRREINSVLKALGYSFTVTRDSDSIAAQIKAVHKQDQDIFIENCLDEIDARLSLKLDTATKEKLISTGLIVSDLCDAIRTCKPESKRNRAEAVAAVTA